MNCQFCNKECKNTNSLINHERLCKLNPSYDPQKFLCMYCGRPTSSARANNIHQNNCKLNPSYHFTRGDKYTSWNKGLTKETSEKVAAHAQNLSQRIQSGEIIGAAGLTGKSNYSCREDVRSKISATMLGNHNNNPSKTGRGRKGWYKGFFCSSTYELAFVIYCLDNNVPIERCRDYYTYTYDNKERRYYPDFLINETIVEIKGYHNSMVDAKTSAVTDRPIKVLYRDDLSTVFDYIYTQYGKVVDYNISDLYENTGR